MEPGSGRLDAAPLDLPASAGPAGGATGDLAFVYDDGGDGERVIAYRRVRGRLPGPVALGGVEPGSWPDACALLTSRDLGAVAGGYRPLPHRRTVGALPLPKPASCDWIPPSDDGAVVSVSVVWVARSDAEARALFDAAVSADKTYGAYDPITEGPGFFTTMVSGGVEGAFGRTLVHVGPVIAEVVSTSARALRIVAPLVRDRMGAPGGGRPVPAGGWCQATDGSVAETPLVDDGVVYFNSHDDRLYAFDAATGRPRRIIAADVSLEAVADGLVYASGADNRLYAFDAATGRRRWSHQRTFSGSTVVMAGSVIAADSVEVVALDAATGRPRWRLPQLGGDTGLAVADNRLYAWGEDEVVALDPESGDVLWRRGARNARLVASGGALYVGDVGTAYALDPATGKARWTTPFRGPVTPVSVTPGTVYFTDEANRTYALDAGTGERQWSFLAKAVKSIGHEVAATRDLAYVAGPDERLHALDPASGARRWSRLLPGGPYTPLVIHGGVCYVGDGAGVLHAFDAATGVERWAFSLGATVQAGPVVTDGHVYVGGGNGILFGLRTTDGAAG
ncbi:PQQ-binding-like beta-propeller repeat protein [Nonomuraea insulae]|uniref:PQQ-binding-like beta-propeller repeat protein n=1 Tax=Nonomuraea insulae TaxID=1616787 RepID=A0ABW1D555_9ACTN